MLGFGVFTERANLDFARGSTHEQKVDAVIQEIVDQNFQLYKRIGDDPDFGSAIEDLLFDQYLRRHRQAEELLMQQKSKTLEFKSSLRWDFKEDRKDDKRITHAVLKTIAPFLNTKDGDLLIGVDGGGKVVGIEHDRLDYGEKLMRHLVQVVANAFGDCAATCIDPRTQVVQGKAVCLVSRQRSPERCTSMEGDGGVGGGRPLRAGGAAHEEARGCRR